MQKKPLIVVSSVTYAMKGKDILAQHGINAYIEKIPKIQSVSGCGYGLYIRDNIDIAYNILADAGIKLKGIMYKDGGG